jgi:hypothetical protein
MSINKPYFRIIKPNRNNEFYGEYIYDPLYSNDRNSLARAYKLIENDFEKLFEYIEPSDLNLATFSHRTYELFLRACTEFETNCRRILDANSYSGRKVFIIREFHNINKAMALHNYEVIISGWDGQCKILKPFLEWENGYQLFWYQAFNQVKHDRSLHLKEASLNNLLNAVAGLLCILFAQFSFEAINPYNSRTLTYSWNANTNIYFLNDSIFDIRPFNDSSKIEKYDFNWDIISKNEHKFEKFIF